MKLRTGDPWMTSKEYGRSLEALSINLVVHDIEQAIRFQREVLGATVIYSDPDFAALEGFGARWIMHADHTYQGHPLEGVLAYTPQRGAGVELRLHGCDPDRAEAAAQRLGYKVLVSAADKNRGLREAYLVDSDGYVWVPDVHSKT